MLDLTKGPGEDFARLDPEVQKKLLERRKFMNGLSQGTTNIPKNLRKQMAKLNKVAYDESYDNIRCPGCDVNKKFNGRACPYQSGDICRLRETLKYSSKGFPGTNYRLFSGVYMDLPDEYEPQVANLIFPKARFDILRLYDKYWAIAMKIKKMETFSSPNVLEQPENKVRLNRLKEAEQAADAELSAMLNFSYQLALRKFFGEQAPTDEELRDAYEEDQYEQRKQRGEPVVFANGRCMFDGYVASQGYLPGPFPGLEFWTTEEGVVDPMQFAKWLADTEFERKRSMLPPVGFTGTPVCGIYSSDVLKNLADWYAVCGSESYRNTMPTIHVFM